MLKKKKAKKETTKKKRVDVKDLAPEELEQVSGGAISTSTTFKQPSCTEAFVKSPSVGTIVKPIVVY